jgi:hypothetical protein
MEAELLTKIEQDWPFTNRLMLQLCVKQSNHAIRELTVLRNTRNPIFDTPNRAISSGMNRWIATDYFLDRACKMGLLPGITSVWVPLVKRKKVDGGPHALELRGKHTSLIALHLKTPIDSPRGSIFRDFRRLLNERRLQNQHFSSLFEEDNKRAKQEIEELEKRASLLNLTLTHGGKDAPFAMLRVYHDATKPSVYVPVFSLENIMLLEPSNSANEEQIQVAELKFSEHLKEIKKQQANE